MATLSAVPSSEITMAPLRLTARGRLVLRGLTWLAMVVALTLLVGLAVLVGGGRADGGEQVTSVPVTYHVVGAGETLWGLATALAPDADPRDMVAQIVELNGLATANVVAGTRLALPVRD